METTSRKMDKMSRAERMGSSVTESKSNRFFVHMQTLETKYYAVPRRSVDDLVADLQATVATFE